MQAKLIAATAGAMLAVALLAASCATGRAAPAAGPAQPPVELVAPALDGGQIDIERYRGQVVVVHIFAPSEASVAREVEDLNALHQGADDVVVIGVALEPGGYPVVSAWRRAMEAEYLIALVTQPEELHSARIDALRALPTTLVIDRQGRLTHRVDRPLRPGEIGQLVAPLRADQESG